DAGHVRCGLGPGRAVGDAQCERGQHLRPIRVLPGDLPRAVGTGPSRSRPPSGCPDPGSLELVDAAQARKFWPTVHAEVRATRVGELAPLPGRWDGLSDGADGTNGPLRYLIHRAQHGDVDGIANLRLPWS